MSDISGRYEFEPFSMVDAPGPCSIIFSYGCNLRCNYCYNVELLELKDKGLNYENIIEKINNIQKINPRGEKYNSVEWLIITGGEPFYPRSNFHELKNIIKCAKDIGLKVGLYTNGTEPGLLDLVLPDLSFLDISYKGPIGLSTGRGDYFKSIELAFNSYANYNLEYFYVSTVMLKTFHNKSIMRDMKQDLFKINDFDILLKRFEKSMGWVFTSFFNNENQTPTFGNIDYFKEKISDNEIVNILNGE